MFPRKMPPRNKTASLYDLQELLVLFVLAALVSNAAAGLACGLTGCLALAASAVPGTVAEITC